MKPVLPFSAAAIAVCIVTSLGAALAAEPIPITADQAFDAAAMHSDPKNGTPANVLLIDVRDPAEYFFNGTAGAVEAIHFRGHKGTDVTVEPDWGKVRLVYGGRFIKYAVKERPRFARVANIANLEIEPLAYGVPLWRFDASDKWGTPEERAIEEGEFVAAITDLLAKLPEEDKPDKVILYCRTGGRSSIAGRLLIQEGLFYWGEVYEIDDPADQNGRGGFSGPAWSGNSTAYNGYNGYGGFPGRQTPPDRNSDVHASVSWLDSGLPVATAVKPDPEAPPD